MCKYHQLTAHSPRDHNYGQPGWPPVRGERSPVASNPQGFTKSDRNSDNICRAIQILIPNRPVVSVNIESSGIQRRRSDDDNVVSFGCSDICERGHHRLYATLVGGEHIADDYHDASSKVNSRICPPW
jgi:hypothetical protein